MRGEGGTSGEVTEGRGDVDELERRESRNVFGKSVARSREGMKNFIGQVVILNLLILYGGKAYNRAK